MGTIPLALASGLYLWVAATYFPHRSGLMLAFIAYALANVGFIWDLIEQGP